MLLVEQGVPGLLFFVGLLFAFFIQGERLYHSLSAYPFQQRLLMGAMLSMVVIVAFLLINDLIETDKVGSFFFINLAILVRLDRWWRVRRG
ncbi:MAG: hypothetical protein D6772_02410 [Bacteroidetes bacterium]|nr:MAG: hypothetical protein D6772_02410 [Bacteroidota bacterium]